jgi:leukotriene-A4 hydrolase
MIEKRTKACFGEKLIVSLTDKHPSISAKLSVLFSFSRISPPSRCVEITFTTSPLAAALQWLSAEQTADRIEPQLFTYCQPIAARSLLPCMDTPAVKHPITATVCTTSYHVINHLVVQISAPSSLRVLMSAVEIAEPRPDPDTPGYTLFSYEQKVTSTNTQRSILQIPIPSYLIAFIVGRLESREISDRIRVWAEPSVIERAHYEMAEVHLQQGEPFLLQAEEQLQMAESLMGEYVWNRCDMVVLPPSFPLGGMENPCLIFLTPTMIAGDRSLTRLVSHEQIHAWFGNLVTNATWEHMW